jgi:hypothetical protein
MYVGQVYVGHMSVNQLLSFGQIPVNQNYFLPNGIRPNDRAKWQGELNIMSVKCIEVKCSSIKMSFSQIHWSHSSYAQIIFLAGFSDLNNDTKMGRWS